MTPIHFPWSIQGDRRYPHLHVVLSRGDKVLSVTVAMLIDTGADTSLFPLSFASLLDISAERDLILAPTKGIGADRNAYMLRLPPPITARVQTEVFPLPEVRFIEGSKIPPILGRDALFGPFELRMNRDEISLSRWPSRP